VAPPHPARRRRLAEELEESGLSLGGDELLLDEIEHALRPPVHERRAASSGTVIDPTTDPAGWGAGTSLTVNRAPLDGHPLTDARRYADGLSSWLLRRTDGGDEWLVFDRPAGSERDMAVLADVMGATLVQRHPAGAVRIAGAFGVLRWSGFAWHHEPPVRSWIDVVAGGLGDPAVLKQLLAFAVHDLGSMGIGSLLVLRPDGTDSPDGDERLPRPPELDLRVPFHRAPLRHALSQVDGAAVFGGDGILRQLGVRLVPSAHAEETIDAIGGTRHTAGRRYSHDDPTATVVAVSEDGPVTVFRDGYVLGHSPDDDDQIRGPHDH
jgi:hypothetical protein